MNVRSGLTQKDLEILSHYADKRNRELYWNYLAELPGNDGYGLLALGVVRHDNMPGATANLYAQNYAREHNGTVLSEREWDNFGVDLITRDLVHRKTWMKKGQPDLALNLPALDVEDAHDKSFNNIKVDPDAWTPRKLIEAARHAGEAEANLQIGLARARGKAVNETAVKDDIVDRHVEKVWSSMLNNDTLGLERGKDTLLNLAAAEAMPVAERATYVRDMAAAYVEAHGERSHITPNIIGRTDHYHARDRTGEWAEIHHAQAPAGMRLDLMDDVNDPAIRRRLEDTYQLRQERAAAREAMHPDDPGRHVVSPHPLAATSPRATMPKAGDDPIYVAIRSQLPMEVSDDKVAEAALQARHLGIRQPGQLGDIDIRERRIVSAGVYEGPSIDLSIDTPARPKDESLTQATQLDQQATAMQQQQDMQMQMQLQQVAMQQSGPAMGL
ncbi:hypothetical protein ACVWWJ_000308 [Luteibacter sp. HA06]|jgi:hypothetical protein